MITNLYHKYKKCNIYLLHCKIYKFIIFKFQKKHINLYKLYELVFKL